MIHSDPSSLTEHDVQSTPSSHLIFNFPLSKLYSNSLLSSLNSRAGWKYGNSGDDEESTMEGSRRRVGNVPFSPLFCFVLFCFVSVEVSDIHLAGS